MRALGAYVLAAGLLPACLAQQWQLGAEGGFGIAKNLTVTGASDSATIVLAPPRLWPYETSRSASKSGRWPT